MKGDGFWKAAAPGESDCGDCYCWPAGWQKFCYVYMYSLLCCAATGTVDGDLAILRAY